MSSGSSLGDRIRAIRRRASLGQEALAQQLSFSTRSLIAWEKGTVEPPLTVVRQLCSEYDVDAGWLIFGTDLEPRRFHGEVDWERYDRLLSMIEKLCVDVGLEPKPKQCEVLARSLFDEGDEADADMQRRLRHTLLALSKR